MASLPGVVFFHRDHRVQFITNRGLWKGERECQSVVRFLFLRDLSSLLGPSKHRIFHLLLIIYLFVNQLSLYNICQTTQLTKCGPFQPHFVPLRSEDQPVIILRCSSDENHHFHFTAGYSNQLGMLSTITQNKKGLPMKISSISDNDQHVPDKVRSKHERVIKQWRANPPTTTETVLDNNPAWNDAIAHPVYHLDLKRKGWCKRRAGCRGGKVQQRPQSPLANLTGDETEMTAKNVEECIFKSRSTGCASSGTTSVLFSPWFA